MLAQFVSESGSWEIDGSQRELRAHGRPVPIGSRAFAIIEKLVESGGQVVSRDELVSHVWGGIVVGENTLRVHIHAIRKALGTDRALLKSSTGRGYQLLGGWETKQEKDSSTTALSARVSAPGVPFHSNLPGSASDIIGRGRALQRLRDLVSAYRVVTLAGPGGIGKTTLAVELARRLLDEFDGRVCFVELASLADPELVPSAVMAALGWTGEGKATTRDGVARAIGTTRLLLVFDNCEHVIDAAAGLAEAIVQQCPRVSLVATSREVMRVAGERVYRVQPLDLPGSSIVEKGERLLDSSAVELFVQRTRTQGGEISLDATTLSTVASICRQLDGIPLAIEFAAARAATLGVQQVASDLSDRFNLLVSRRRTPLPRHRTLRATLDWSCELLPESERALLHCLGIFAGPFTLDDAGAISATDDIIEGLSNLVHKSLVVLESTSAATVYRLLDTTRAYALEKLDASGERDPVAQRHGRYYQALLERIEPEWESRPAAELRADYAWRIDNVRAAVDWAFSRGGNDPAAIGLTAAAVPLWMHLSLFGECHARAEQALQAVVRTGVPDAIREMKLDIAIGNSLLGIGQDPATARAAWERGLALSRTIGDVDYQLRALWGLWYADMRQSIQSALQFAAIAITPRDKLVALRMIGVSHHNHGNQSDARTHLESLLANPALQKIGVSSTRFVGDLQAAAQAFLARVLWVQGYPDQAMQMATRAVERAKFTGHAFSLGHALHLAACPVAIWTGDWERAREYIDLLGEQRWMQSLSAQRSNLGARHRSILLIKQGEISRGVDMLRSALGVLGTYVTLRGVSDFRAELAWGLGCSGRVDEGIDAIEDVILFAEDINDGWIHPELLRIKGELLRLKDTDQDSRAESCFREALEEANDQGALSWELRAATSLARLLRDQGRAPEAAAAVRAVYDRFTEGLETLDLRSARTLLDSLH